MSGSEENSHLKDEPSNRHPQYEHHTPFARLPQRYHRRSFSLKKEQDSSTSPDLSVEDYSTERSDSTDHALEADDEKGQLVRLLPAPPVRVRKGLRGHDSPLDSTPVISPLPTPGIEKQPSVWADGFDEKETQKQKQQEQDQAALYAKYQKRRQTEIVRRSTETLLLALIGAGVCAQNVQNNSIKIWKPELVTFMCTVAFLYALYPIRVSLANMKKGLNPSVAVRRGFHVPSRFDPGSLLYPVFLPLFIALSLSQDGGVLLITNMVLGLSSIPGSTIPLQSRSGLSLFHWILTLSPIYIPEIYTRMPGRTAPVRIKMTGSGKALSNEELALLFPMHQMFLVTITYVTTTSLDPSEAQLLSTGLVNLLLFAKSPQAEILKALIGLGGLVLFAFCGRALSWEVALARIPTWKFARNKPSRTGFMGRVNKLLTVLLPESPSRFAVSSALSDSESDGPSLPVLRKSKTRVEGQQRHKDRSSSDAQFAKEKVPNLMMKEQDGFPDLVRSATFSTFGRAATIAVRWRRRIASTSRFLSLTYAQAQALKWLLAIYAYLATALIILVPVRYYISMRALSSLEPIGWAIGYFLGDLQQARMFVVNNRLERWIALPTHKSQVWLETGSGWVETYRQIILGAANTRLLLAAYCVCVVACGLGAVQLLKSVVEVDTRRKVFHGVMVAMLLPTIPVDPCFFALALAIVLAVFLMLDLFRASQLPPISKPLTTFLAPFVDGRDHRGPVVVSHIFLLIGCAIPLWLSLAGATRAGVPPWNGWDTPTRDLSMISGVVCVGMGDAAASLVGRRYGKTKWYWGGGKSIEGSLAFAVAVTIGLTASYVWLRVGAWTSSSMTELPLAVCKAMLAGSGASLLESTLTAANDNVVVPIGLWLLVRGLDM